MQSSTSSVCDHNYQLLHKLHTLLRQQQLKKKNPSCDRPLILVSGLTGAGKSTFINYLIGNKLQQQKKDGERRLVNVGNFPGPIIGDSSVDSCTVTPEIYDLPGISDFNVCDTPGFESKRERRIENQIMTELFLSRAKSICAIIVIISAHDLNACRGDSFKNLTDELSRYSNLDEIRHKFLFVYNRFDADTELDDLFEKLCAMEKDVRKRVEKEDYSQDLRIYQLILQKKSVYEKPSFDKFKEANVLVTRKNMLNPQLRQMILSMIEKMPTTQGVNLRVSPARIELLNYINRKLIRQQIKFKEAIGLYKRYKVGEKFLWNQLGDADKLGELNLLNEFMNVTNIQATKKEIQQLETILKALRDKTPKQVTEIRQSLFKISKLPDRKFSFTLHFDFEIFPPHKDRTAGEFLYEKLEHIKGAWVYSGVFQAYENIETEKDEVKMVFMSCKEFMEAPVIQLYEFQKSRLEKIVSIDQKIQKTDTTEEFINIKKEVLRLKDSSRYQTFVDKYSIRWEDLLDALPTRREIAEYTVQTYVMGKIAIFQNGLLNFTLKNELFQAEQFLSLNDVQTHCALNYHVVMKKKVLECEHLLQDHCYKRLVNSNLDKVLLCPICEDLDMDPHKSSRSLSTTGNSMQSRSSG